MVAEKIVNSRIYLIDQLNNHQLKNIIKGVYLVNTSGKVVKGSFL